MSKDSQINALRARTKYKVTSLRIGMRQHIFETLKGMFTEEQLGMPMLSVWSALSNKENMREDGGEKVETETIKHIESTHKVEVTTQDKDISNLSEPVTVERFTSEIDLTDYSFLDSRSCLEQETAVPENILEDAELIEINKKKAKTPVAEKIGELVIQGREVKQGKRKTKVEHKNSDDAEKSAKMSFNTKDLELPGQSAIKTKRKYTRKIPTKISDNDVLSLLNNQFNSENTKKGGDLDTENANIRQPLGRLAKTTTEKSLANAKKTTTENYLANAKLTTAEKSLANMDISTSVKKSTKAQPTSDTAFNLQTSKKRKVKPTDEKMLNSLNEIVKDEISQVEDSQSVIKVIPSPLKIKRGRKPKSSSLLETSEVASENESNKKRLARQKKVVLHDDSLILNKLETSDIDFMPRRLPGLRRYHNDPDSSVIFDKLRNTRKRKSIEIVLSSRAGARKGRKI